MDPEMSAITMQHRASQACNSCRRLKRKCIYNPTLGKCDRCYESGKPCVYAEVNSTAPSPVSVTAPSPSLAYTNAGPSDGLNATLNQYSEPMYLDSFGAFATPDGPADIAYGDQRNASSDGSMGAGNDGTTHPSSHAGRQF